MAAESLHYRAALACFEEVQQIDFPELPAGRVFFRKVPADWEATLAAVFVCPLGQETLPEVTFEDTDVGWPVAVFFVTGQGQDRQVKEVELRWREQVIDRCLDIAARDVLLASVPEVYEVQVEPGPVTDLPLWRDTGLAVGSLTLRCFTRKSRNRRA